jgi:DNA-binding LacI/PurR family transcriptional regulator
MELGIALHADEIGGDFNYAAGYRAAQRLIARRPVADAIFFASDIMAIGDIEAIRVAGLRVPDDVSVVGFDDIIMAGWPAYDLTTIRQRIADMVECAAQFLELEGPRKTKPFRKTEVLKGELVERTSVANRPCSKVAINRSTASRVANSVSRI